MRERQYKRNINVLFFFLNRVWRTTRPRCGTRYLSVFGFCIRHLKNIFRTMNTGVVIKQIRLALV